MKKMFIEMRKNMSLKFGRRAPKNSPAIMLDNVLSGIVPAHPLEFDYVFITGLEANLPKFSIFTANAWAALIVLGLNSGRRISTLESTCIQASFSWVERKLIFVPAGNTISLKTSFLLSGYLGNIA